MNALIHGVVAVVVFAVAQLSRAGASGRVFVVAVLVVGDEADGHGAGHPRDRGVAEEVTVAVLVPRGQQPLVDAAHAVVVDAVADLGGGGLHRGVRVVAVAAAFGAAVAHPAVGERGRVVAVAVAVGVNPDGEVQAVVGFAVAVVVDAVADLVRVRVRRGIVVVAVVAVRDPAGTGRAAHFGLDRGAEAVAVAVGVQRLPNAFVVHAVAVVVFAVADLRRAGEAARVDVVTVVGVVDVAGACLATLRGERRVSVSVSVRVREVRAGEALIDLPVAVVVQIVTKLGRARINARVRVVAVLVRHEAVVVEILRIPAGKPPRTGGRSQQ